MTIVHAPIEPPKEGDSLLGKYILEKPLGQGGMGIVYAARHELLGQRVAVKFLLPEIASSGDAVARFLNEARAASRIESDHVARVLDVGLVHGALPYMVLEFLEGDDLAIVLRKRGPLPIADVADYVLEAIDALAYAHALGIVHRDLKPANLFLVQRQDGSSRVKVLDFGISKMMGAEGLGGSGNITKTNAMLGSPLYMSPEQLRDSKSVDHRCDIWALGVIAYELLTSHPPFMAENAVALFAAIQETEPLSPRARRPDGAIPPELERAVLQCLRRNPNERFASVTELGAALVPFGTDAGTRAFRNASRVLPLRVSASLPTGPHAAVTPALSAPSPSAHTVLAPGGPYANTANPWARSRGAATPSGPNRWLIVGRGLAGVLGLTGVLAGGRYVVTHRHAGGAPSAVTASDPPSASAVTSAPPSAVSAVSPPPSSGPVPPSTTPASPAPRPKGGATAASAVTHAASPSPRPSAAPARNCDPPYTIDNAGHHVLKPGCE